MNNKYIIKNLAPWMLDELLALSEFTNFEIILLRKQDDFYDDGLKNLTEKGVDIKLKPYSTDRFFSKIVIAFKFFFSNLSKFRFDYNFIIGIKTIFWFLKIDINLFSKESIIHAQFATQSSLLSFLIKKFYGNKPKYFFTFHAYDIYFKNKWFQLLTEECERCFSISEYNIRYIENNYLKTNKIKLARLGVFREESNNEARLIPEKDKFTLGVLSWFVEKKGIVYLLRAMDELSKYKNKQIELIIAGDGPLKEEYLSFIEKNNLHNNVKLIGKVKEKQKKDFYNDIDLFILPSISLENDQDGIPVVLMEAISYGLPIISTDVSGIPEICIDGFNGFLINEKDSTEIVNAVLNVYNNPNKYKLFSSNSKKLSEEYDIIKNTFEKFKKMNWKQK